MAWGPGGQQALRHHDGPQSAAVASGGSKGGGIIVPPLSTEILLHEVKSGIISYEERNVHWEGQVENRL